MNLRDKQKVFFAAEKRVKRVLAEIFKMLFLPQRKERQEFSRRFLKCCFAAEKRVKEFPRRFFKMFFCRREKSKRVLAEIF